MLSRRQKMEHVERMKVELKELEQKITKGAEFLEKEIESPKFTDNFQRVALGIQLSHMQNYASVLKDRIDYDTEKANKKDVCSTSNNYDTLTKECFK